MAIARSVIIDKHGGDLTFKTAKGRGTTFYVRIPLREWASNVKPVAA